MMPTTPLRTLAEKVHPEHTALVVVDMQNDYCTEGGACDRNRLPLAPVRGVIPAVQRLLAGARRAGATVVYAMMTADPATESPPWREKREEAGLVANCLDGSWGHQIVEELRPEPGDVVVRKRRFSAFLGTHLDMALRGRGVRTCVAAGVVSNGCVDCTVRDAFQLDYYVVPVADAVAGYVPDLHAATLVNWQRRYGTVAGADEVLRCWERVP